MAHTNIGTMTMRRTSRLDHHSVQYLTYCTILSLFDMMPVCRRTPEDDKAMFTGGVQYLSILPRKLPAPCRVRTPVYW